MKQDARLEKLTENIFDYSLKVEEGECFLVWCCEGSQYLLKNLAVEAVKRGITLIYTLQEEYVIQAFLSTLPSNSDRAQAAVNLVIDGLENQLKQVDGIIIIRGKELRNPFEGVLPDNVILWQRGIGKLFAISINTKKWVVLDWPTQLQADKAGMTYNQFYDYVMRVSGIDYAALHKAALPLKELLDKTDKVQIFGRGTNLTFSKKGINTIIGTAENSYIDGEVYTAPVRESLEGYLTYNIATNYLGHDFEGVRFVFSKGKIVEASCEKGSVEMLNRILDTDDGARYIGEFALGINPEVTVPMNDIHYDEKINASFHLTPGQCYDTAPNGNTSSVHWDLVCLQTPEMGGGEIWCDGRLIRKNGKFVIPELEPLG